MTRSRIGIQKTIPRSTASAVLCARLWCCFAVFQLVGSSALAAEIPKDIEKNFIQPPSSCRPWVNWFWMDGNITKEGITADLEAMQRVGIGGALLMDVSQEIPRGPVRFGSPEWFALFHHAATEADRLGLKLSINNDPGWSGSGGPWVTPELAMQQLVWSKTNVTGPIAYRGPLPLISPVRGYLKDVAILAFPTVVGDGAAVPGFNPKLTASFRLPSNATNLFDHNPASGISLSDVRNSYLQLEFPQPFNAQQLSLLTGVTNRTISGELQISDNGRSFKKVREFVIRKPALVLEFEQVSAKFYRLSFNEGQAQKTPVEIFEIALAPVYRIPMFQVKSGMGRAEWPPLQNTNAPMWAVVQRDKVVDLTSRRDGSGRLNWDVPPGEWTIVRFAHVPVGTENHPPNVGGLGLECDKLSKSAVEQHFRAFLGNALTNSTFAGTHIDSWEIGFQNWTESFLDEFKKRRRYDALSFLPAYSGRVVESPEISERFFWDVRRTVADLLADNYAGHLAELAHAHGLTLSIEAYANGPFDQLQYASRADVPMAEFWTEKEDHSRLHTSRVMASAAHTGGKPVVAAEAFTSHSADGSWINHPFSLKPLADAAMCEGVNHFVFHCYAHQPWLNLAPGMTMGPFGVHYDRNETWWEKSKPWHEYLARCEYMLESGHFVADICYLTREGAYTDPPTPGGLQPPLPEGYNYDFASPEAFKQMAVKDGRIVLPGGMSYRTLVLPQTREMSPSFSRKLRELVTDGATVFGPRPEKSPSLEGFPKCDEEVRGIAGELWGDNEAKGADLKAGKIRQVTSLKKTLAVMRIPPDFEQKTKIEGNPLKWIHRAIDGIDVYFIANSNAQPAKVDCAFRVEGMQPELWHPDTGGIEKPACWRQRENLTELNLELDPFSSVFVLFRKRAGGIDPILELARNGKRDGARANFDSSNRVQLEILEQGRYRAKTSSGKVMEWNVTNLPSPLVLAGSWDVHFQKTFRATAADDKLVTFESLCSWTERKEPEIKYFSGTATYSKTFAIPNDFFSEMRRAYLELGEVNVISSVRLNGKDLGTLWKPPFRTEATGALRKGENSVEIDVVNLWPNRLIGDERLPEDCDWKSIGSAGGGGLARWPEWMTPAETSNLKSRTSNPDGERFHRPSGRQTFSTWKYWRKDSPLLPSGLIGPVRLIAVQTVH